MGAIPILLAILSGIIALFVKNKWKTSDLATRCLMIIGVITPIVIGINTCRQNLKDKRIAEVESRFGRIDDLDGATIPKLTIGPDDNAAFEWFAMSEMSIGTPGNVFKLFRLYVQDGKLFVDIVIRDKNGDPIAVINKNEWYNYKPNDYEYNNDDTGFELVTKGDRKVYFHVYLKNGIAHILGFVINENGEGVKFYQPANETEGFKKKLPTDYSVHFSVVAVGPGAKESLYKGVDGRIFKYPREQYVGQRE